MRLLNLSPGSRTPHQGATHGFSLVELMVTITVLVVAMLSTVSTITTVSSLGEANRETTVAYQAARSMIETLQAEDFSQVFARYNDDRSDDPGGPGTAPGMHFNVAGLDPQAGDPDGFVGRVVVPAPGPTLREDVNDSTLGLPRDLSGDGLVDAFDHATDHILLPVRVRVEWTGGSGDRRVEFATMLSLRE